MNRRVVALLIVVAGVCASSVLAQDAKKDAEELKRRPAPEVKVALPIPREFKQKTKVAYEDVMIELVSGTIEKTKLKRNSVSGLIDVPSGPANLNIKLRVSNEGVSPIKYLPWHSYKTKPAPSAKDEFGDALGVLSLQVATWPAGFQRDVAKIMPGSPIIDLISFSAPSFLAEEIDITLPGANVGHPKKMFAFKVGRGFFEDAAKRPDNIKEYVRLKTEAVTKKWDVAEDKRIAAVKERIRLADVARLAEAEAEKQIAAIAKSKADRTKKVGDFEIYVQTMRFGIVELRDELRRNVITRSKTPLVMVTVAITNKSDTKLRWYEPWGAKAFSVNRSLAKMDDEFGNAYPSNYFSIGIHPVDQLTKKTRIDPGATIHDVIIFDPPIDKAQTLTLRFPGANLGVKSDARIIVSRSILSSVRE